MTTARDGPGWPGWHRTPSELLSPLARQVGPALDLARLTGAGAEVERRWADQAAQTLLLEDVRGPSGHPGTGEERGEHVCRNLGEVEHHGRPELDVGRQHPV